MYSHCVDLSTPPHHDEESIAPTQLEPEGNGTDTDDDDDAADMQPRLGNHSVRMINIREQCDAIIASRPRTDDDPIMDVESSGSPNVRRSDNTSSCDGTSSPLLRTCEDCGEDYVMYHDHWGDDNGFCYECSSARGLGYLDEFNNRWVMRAGQSLPPGCRHQGPMHAARANVQLQSASSTASLSHAMRDSGNEVGVDTIKTPAAFRDSWSLRIPSACLEPAQASRIAAMHDQLDAIPEYQHGDDTQARSSTDGCVESPTQADEVNDIIIIDTASNSRPTWFCGEPRQWP